MPPRTKPMKRGKRLTSSSVLKTVTTLKPAADGDQELPTYLSAYTRTRIQIQEDGCWYWTGSISPKGYGRASLPGNKGTGAHRLVVRQSGASLPDGAPLDHQCHNRDTACAGGPTCLHRRCVNPDHLETATPRENVCRGKSAPALNLAKETCPKGHEYDHTDSRGWRKCSKCERATENAKRRAAGIPERKTWEPECSRGHEFTPENTRWYKGYRVCKTCERAKLATRRARQRKPCRGCGGPMPGGSARRYCPACIKERESASPSKRRPRDTGFSREVKLAVRARAGGGEIDDARCEATGVWLGRYGGQVQHRVARLSGGRGRKAPWWFHTPANAALMSVEAHRRAEARDEHLHAAGFWLTSTQDASVEPVMLHDSSGGGITVWLAADGSYEFKAPGSDAA